MLDEALFGDGQTATLRQERLGNLIMKTGPSVSSVSRLTLPKVSIEVDPHEFRSETLVDWCIIYERHPHSTTTSACCGLDERRWPLKIEAQDGGSSLPCS